MNSSTNSQDSSDDQHPRNLSDFTGSKSRFKFPPKPRLSKSVNNSYASSASDSSKGFRPKRRSKKLPPLGIFWDIENCQVPKNKSASAVVQRIREFFLRNYREAEFLVVCDVKKERPQIVQELHDSQVNLIHVSSTSKNAADEKLRQSLRRFAEVHPAPSCIVLISGDINFAADLSDLRYRKKIRVILVHNSNVADALILCSNEHHCYATITEGLPVEKVKSSVDSAFLLVSNLPRNLTVVTIKNRLNFLSNNCGGKVVEVIPEDGLAFMRFSNQDVANRAQKRIQGEDVFGNKVKVTPSLRNYSGRRVKADGSFHGYLLKDKKHYDLGPSPMMEYERRLRTPQDPLSSRVHTTSGSSEFSDDFKMDLKGNQPVDLIISNLDASITIKELSRMLTVMLKDCAMILHLSVTLQPDGAPVANLRVNSQQAAKFIISQLHRQKVGHKKILVSYAHSNSQDLDQLKVMVISILQEVPDNRMPLFKFMELLESRYHCTFSVSDVNKLKDICKISEHLGSRIISFSREIKSSPPPNLSKILVPYCTVHCADGLPNLGWCEVNTIQLPYVMMALKLFALHLNLLLDTHLGCIPLLSFQACYEQEFHEPLSTDYNGIPLEHLIGCVKDVGIKLTGPSKNIKVIKRESRGAEMDEDFIMKNFPPSLASNISLFSRELVDLLKTAEKCQLLLSKFVPAYHRHFGRQLHVADYGYTKLIDLLEAVSHVVQIIDDGTIKIITLSHQAQVRRFTSDLLRVLKVQPAKQIFLAEFPNAYEKVLNKTFSSVDYGLCFLQDLIEEVPENIVVITQTEDNVVIAVPKREQTAKEIMRTKQFGMEVIDILKHSPHCTMLFNKFVPAYHHHFGHQCRVSDYGFTKLIDLFEAIPDVVKVQELANGERTVTLTLSQSLKILGSQLKALLRGSPTGSILFGDLAKFYFKEYGYPLKPQVYESETISELVRKLSDYVQVVQDGSAGPQLISVDAEKATTTKIRVWALLIKPPYCKEASLFTYEYQSRYNDVISVNNLKQLRNVVSLSFINDTNYVALTDLYVLAAQLYNVLYNNGGSVSFSSLERLYQQSYGKDLRLGDFSITSLTQLYTKFDFLFFTSGYKKNVLALNRSLAEYQISLPIQIFNSSHALKNWPQPLVHKVTKISPPKPDTPPTPVASWMQNSIYIPNLNLQLPIITNPQLLGDPYDLISPAKHLFPWGKAPEPHKLPMPDKLMFRDESNDSGVNSRLEHSDDGAKSLVRSYLSFDN